jgi:hypothetical protein
MARSLQPGDRIRVYGGYESEPDWLAQSPEGYVGTVRDFVEGWGDAPSALVELDHEISVSTNWGVAAQGRFLVLIFAWAEMDWSKPGPRLHVCLLGAPPDDGQASQAEFKRTCVESHASWNFAS